MRRAPNRPRRAPLSPRRLVSTLAWVAVGALPAQAQPQSQTQIREISPRWVVITEDATPIRCDDFERFYKVASLDTGAVLRTDGQSQQWARVIYPADVPALVPAADVRVIDDQTVELKTPSRLRAPSMILGIAGSWRSLYSEALPAGTRLEVIEKELGANDEVAAYRVKAPHPPIAPEPPYAYVKLGSIRDASPAETQAHLKAMSRVPGASPVPVKPAEIIPDAVELADEQTPVEAIESTPAQSRTPTQTPREVVERVDDQISPASSEAEALTAARPVEESEGSLLEPMVLPGQEEVVQTADAAPASDVVEVDSRWIQGGLTTPEASDTTSAPSSPQTRTDPQAGVQENVDRTVQDRASLVTDVTPIAEGSVEHITQGSEGTIESLGVAPEMALELAPEPASIEDLEQALTAARRLPKAALDEALDELHAEFTRTLHAEEAKGQDDRVLEALRRRVAWLDLRIKTRDQRRALDAALAQASSREIEISRSVRTWQSSRSYSMVGRLAPSAVYDGQRLPLMYRVQSIDPLIGPRTIGYVRPSEGQRFDDRLGQIVGIIGSTTDDDALSLRIIRPERVDALDAATFATVPTE
ncbi:MAG: hypothetical protein ACIARR_11720 [Phycisphaerales bacterium JB059]